MINHMFHTSSIRGEFVGLISRIYIRHLTGKGHFTIFYGNIDTRDFHLRIRKHPGLDIGGEGLIFLGARAACGHSHHTERRREQYRNRSITHRSSVEV